MWYNIGLAEELCGHPSLPPPLNLPLGSRLRPRILDSRESGQGEKFLGQERRN
ncbi:hypothetical protein HYW17_01140 [Candidatus Uhrbacteria bacterium]|nr:hypothetical protein [Candidatus Uhrbacteria bacterium]